MDAVERISSDALLVMRAMVAQAKGTFRNFSGTLPTNPQAAAKFKQSGFFAGFAKPPKDLPAPQGMIRRKSNTVVASEVAGELVQFAVNHAQVSHAVAEASYKNLVELMGNTHNHAAARQDRQATRPQRWQASVYCESNVAYFTFADLGVGILRSTAPKSFLRSVGGTLANYGQPRLLQDTFRGIIGASADVPGRGFGLTRMREAAQSQLLPELRVLTLAVVGEVANMNFRNTESTFRGTLFRWTTGQPGIES